ncbi:MMPL family transporter [Paenibacillus sp. 1P07SE]
MKVTLAVWLIVMLGISAGPRLEDYKVTNFQSLPDDAPSIQAERLLEQYFPNDRGTPGILVFHNEQGETINLADVEQIVDAIQVANISGIASIIDVSQLPPPALAGFTSESQSTVILPMVLESGLGNAELSEINDAALSIGQSIAESVQDLSFYITGPAGIAGDTVKLFMEADFVLLLATVVIILVLLIVIYRSPLLALIPLLATVIVYQIVNQLVALMGAAGLVINNSTTSIMSILLFAAVIDYSLFVFSRYREELIRYESKHEAMTSAMRATGEPVFFAGGTVLAAMLVLFLAQFRDYQNFAPVFGMAMIVIMAASITLVPALFTLFGRQAFWPKVPVYGQAVPVKKPGAWSAIARFVVNKPVVSGGIVGVFLIVSALNVVNLAFEFDTVKSFPKDMPSRVGYEIVEHEFDKGELAPSTLLVIGREAITEESITRLREGITASPEVASVRLHGQNEEQHAVSYSIALSINPYSPEALDYVSALRDELPRLMGAASLDGEAHLAGITPKLADERTVNNRDIITIIILETLLILILLMALTRSWRMPLYMMAVNLLSFVSALGLGLFLVDILFGFDAISTRVPVYAFIFLIALGIDYNIILVSRFLEERKAYRVKDALERALSRTGGVISSAGIILAATFAALTTMPIADLFVFGFIVAIGILMDTFLVRGMLLPSLILFFEKDGHKKEAAISD